MTGFCVTSAFWVQQLVYTWVSVEDPESSISLPTARSLLISSQPI